MFAQLQRDKRDQLLREFGDEKRYMEGRVAEVELVGQRHARQQVYTSIGPIILALNPCTRSRIGCSNLGRLLTKALL